jgi:hypothetical protein
VRSDWWWSGFCFGLAAGCLLMVALSKVLPS